MGALPAALEVTSLRKEYPRRGAPPVVAVRDVTFRVGQGELVGLLGPNGAGKTTTLKCVLGLVELTGGEIRIFGHDARRERRQAAARVAAVLEGSRNVFWRMSVRENLDYFALLRGLSRRALRARRERLIEAFGLGPHADKEAHALSAGLRQRLATACALIQQAPLILLDEPTLGLDVESAVALESLLRELVARDGVTILLTSHELEMIQRVAERVIIIQSGEVVADAPVGELLALFRSRRYRCVVTPAAGGGPASLPSDLEPVLAAPPRKNGEQWTLELDLGAPEQLFDCLAALRQSGFVIESVARDQPDLRQAYLRLVRGERAGAPAPLAVASGPAQACTGREEARSDG
ncbi:MAG: ABC transporter ATP-binding protein [Limnochordaceae bacterium]|nr:ABC transporter ATP-binding protein [Limnochordaceae bacterium]